MASRRYTIESKDDTIDGKTFSSIYKAEQETKAHHGIMHEEIYNAKTDEYEYTGSFDF